MAEGAVAVLNFERRLLTADCGGVTCRSKSDDHEIQGSSEIEKEKDCCTQVNPFSIVCGSLARSSSTCKRSICRRKALKILLVIVGPNEHNVPILVTALE